MMKIAGKIKSDDKQITVGSIVFRPPLEKEDEAFVRDEVIAKNADLHFEYLGDDAAYMTIKTENDSWCLRFWVGDEEIEDEEGKKTRRLIVRADQY
jgi:hypothetical protein